MVHCTNKRTYPLYLKHCCLPPHRALSPHFQTSILSFFPNSPTCIIPFPSVMSPIQPHACPPFTPRSKVYNVHVALFSNQLHQRSFGFWGGGEVTRPSQQGGCGQSHPDPFGLVGLRFLHRSSARSRLPLAHQEERLPFSCLETRKSVLKARYCAGLPQVAMRGCKTLTNVSLEVSGHAGLPGIFVERVTPMVAIKCDCYDMPALRNTVFTPLFNFRGLKITIALFFLSMSPLLVIYLVLFGISPN